MARGIREGDKVKIHLNDNASLDRLVFDGRALVIWAVAGRPRGEGDTWAFERKGQIIEINPCSANFDGLELVERREAS